MSRRKWVATGYPGKPHLSESEAMNELRHGPKPEWFEPWAEHAVVIADPEFQYGYVHAHGDPVQFDVKTFRDQEGLNWGLGMLHTFHTQFQPQCRECQGVVYFTPDEPVRLFLEIEEDDQ